MTAHELYLTGVMESFSTFCANTGVSYADRKTTSIQLLTLLQVVSTKTGYLNDPAKLLEESLKTDELDSKATELLRKFFENQPPHQTTVLLRQFLLSLTAVGCSYSTIKNYRSDINQFFNFALSTDLNAILVKPKLQQFITQEHQNGSSAATIKRKLSSITQFSIWLEQVGYLEPYQSTAIESLNKNAKFIEESLVTDTTPSSAENTKQLKPSNSRLSPALSLGAAEFSSTQINTNNTQNNSKGIKPLNLQSPKHQEYYHQLKSNLLDIQRKLNTKTSQLLLPYLNIAFLVLFFIGLSYFGYQQLYTQVNQSLAFPTSLTRPNRVLSFQGRLTDTAQNPITSATNFRFKLYDSGPSIVGGTQLWDSGSCSVTPDQDGIFNVGLGSDCGSEIGSSVFSENANIWLQVEVAAETLSPRQSIKTVAYALNSETLQGYPASASATENTVLVMNNSGEVVLGNTNPLLKSTGTSFTIEGRTLTLRTASGSNGNISLAPDGIGKIIATRYIEAPGATLSATYAGGTALITRGGPSGTANIQEWQSSAGTALSVVNALGNIGIGTSSPSTGSLEIYSARDTSYNRGQIISADTTAMGTGVGGSIGFWGKYTSGGSYADAASIWAAKDNASTGDYGFSLNFGTRQNGVGSVPADLTISSTGNVAVGTTSPLGKLDVLAGSARSGTHATAPSFYVTGSMSTGQTGSSTGNIEFRHDNGTQGIGFGYNTIYQTGSNTNQELNLLSRGNSPITLNAYGYSTGNVAIGTTTASNFKLEVQGSVGPQANNTYNLGSNSLRWANVYATNFYQNGNTVCDSSGNCPGALNYWRLNLGALSPINNTLDLLVGSNATSSAKFAFINVNSGTPTASISGNLAIAAPSGTSPATTYDVLNNGTLNFRTSPGGDAGLTSRLLIKNDGNVGIATTTPGSKLTVYGTSQASASTTNGIFKIDSTATNALIFGTLTGSPFAGYIQSGGSGTYPLALNPAGGNVGIGTSSPTDKLNVAGNANIDGTIRARITADATNGARGIEIAPNAFNSQQYIRAYANSGAGLNLVGYSTGTGQDVVKLFLDPGNGLITFGTNTSGAANTERMRIAADGNVGIGTTAPNSKLDIAGNLNVSGASTVSATYAGGIAQVLRGGPSGTADILQLQNNTGTVLSMFNSAGNLGLGTTSATTKLDIQVDGAGAGAIIRYNGSDYMTLQSGGIYKGIAGTGSVPLRFTNGSNLLILQESSGNVAIGTTTASNFKLEVQGSVGPQANNTYNLGSNSLRWANVYATNFFQNGNTVCDISGNCSTAGLWQNNNNAFSPRNEFATVADVLIGSTATASAKFGFINVNSGSPTATIAGNLAITAPTGTNAATTYTALNGGSINFRTSPGGDAGVSSRIFIKNDGNIGIGSTSPAAKLDINGTLRTNSQVAFGADTASAQYGINSARGINVIHTAAPADGTGSVGIRSEITRTSSNTAGSPNAAYFGKTIINAPAATVVDNAVFWAENGTATAGTMTNQYGLYVDPLTTATNNYAVYTSGSTKSYFGGNVGLGTTSPTAQLEVLGTSTPQLKLSYNTSNNTTFTISSGGDLTVAPSGGDANITGTLDVSSTAAIGSAASTNTSRALNIDHVFTDLSTSNYGAYVLNESEPAAGAGSYHYGVYGYSRLDTAQTLSAGLRGVGGQATLNIIESSVANLEGLYGLASISNAVTATATAARGVNASFDAEDGTITTGYSLYGSTGSVDLGSIGTGYGVYVAQGTTGPGTRTTQYGLRIAALTTATTDNFGIWGDSGDWVLDSDGDGVSGGTGAGGDLFIGESQDLEIYHDGTNSNINNLTGSLIINGGATTRPIILQSSTGNVGVGTTIAGAKLDVAGTVSSSGTLAFRGTTDPKIDVLNAENFGVRTSPGGDAGLTERFTITTDGNVGIGSTTPTANHRLDVNGNIFASGGGVYSSNNFVFGSSTSAGEYLAVSGNDINVLAGGSSRLYIDGDVGNVGVGTTDPASFKLQVNGSVGPQTNNTFDLGSNSLRWANVYATAFFQAGNAVCDTSGNCGDLLWANTNGVHHPRGAYADVVDVVVGGTSTASADFRVTGLGNGSTDLAGYTYGRRFIDIDAQTYYTEPGNTSVAGAFAGNIGIGTTNPGAALQIQLPSAAVAGATQYIVRSNPTVAGAINSAQTALYGQQTFPVLNLTGGSSNTITDYFGELTDMTITAGTVTNYYGNYIANPSGGTISNKYSIVTESGAGNAGIGTTNPNHLLELNGTAATAANGLAFGTSGTVDVELFRGAADRLDLASGDSLNLVSGAYRVGNTDVITSGRLVQAANGTVGAPSLTFSSDSNTGFYTDGSDKLQITTAGSNRMVIDSAGNVGIGTTDPASFKLQVNGSVGPQTNNTFDLGSNSLRWANVYATAFFQAGNAVCDTSGNCTNSGLWQNTLNAFHPRNEWASVADVLIGGSSTASAKFAFTNVAAGTPTATISGNLALSVPTGSAPANTFDLLNNGTLNIRQSPGGNANLTSRLFIANNGNVGLGNVTSPTQALDINGDLRVRGNDITDSADATRITLGTTTTLTNTTTTLSGTSTLTASSLATFTTASSLSMASTTALTLGNNATVTLGASTGGTVNGSSASDGDLTIQGTSNATRTSSYVAIQPNGGNVGIGTSTAANSTLEVDGNMRVFGTQGYIKSMVSGGGGAVVQGIVDTDNSFARSIFGHNAYWDTTTNLWNAEAIGANDMQGILIPNNGGFQFITHASTANSARTMDHATFTAGAKMTILNGGSVGIGTTNPSELLHVAGDVRVTGAFYDSSNSAGSDNYILTSTGTGTQTAWVNPESILDSGWWDNTLNVIHPRGAYAAISDLVIGGSSTASADFQVIGSGASAGYVYGRRFIDIDATSYYIEPGNSSLSGLFAGNIGIGTTSTRAILDIAGDASTSGSLVFRGSSPATIDVLNNGRLDIQASPGGDAGLAAKLSIQSDGNVGIGTTSPSVPLEVVSADAYNLGIMTSMYSSTALRGAELSGKRARGTMSSPAVVQDGDVTFQFRGGGYDGTGYYYSAGLRTRVDGTVSSGVVPQALVFITGTNSNPSERMRLTSDGNLGIGTTAPRSVVGVNGDLNISGSATISGTYAGNVALTLRSGPSATGDITRWTNNTGTILNVVNSAGNFGIGTSTAANFKVEVQGSVGPQANNTYNLGSNSLRWNNVYANAFFQNGSAVCDASGNCGNFWTNTANVIHPVNAYAEVTDLAIGGTSTATAEFRVTGIGNGTTNLAGYVYGKRFLDIDDTNYYVEPGNTTTAGLFSGNVAIGTTTTLAGAFGSAKLQVDKTSNGTLALHRESADTGGSTLEFLKRRTAWGVVTSGDRIGSIGFSAADSVDAANAAQIYAEVDGTPGSNDMPGRLVFATTLDGANAVTERMRIDNAGNVGVGTTSSFAKLDVSGAAAAGRSLLLRSGDANTFPADSHQILFGYNGANDYMHSIRSRHNSAADAGNALDFYVWDSGTDSVNNVPGTNFVMTMNGGNVGVGTDTPATKLAVDSNSNTQALRLYGTAETTEIADIFVSSDGHLQLDVTGGSDSSQYIDLRSEDDQWGLILRDSSGLTSNYANFYVTDSAADYLNIVVNAATSTTGLVVQSGGNVGVGTTAPATTLSVFGPSTSFQVSNTTSPSVGMYFSASNNDLYIGGDSSQDGNIFVKNLSGSARIELDSAGESFITGPLGNAYSTGSNSVVLSLGTTNANFPALGSTWNASFATNLILSSSDIATISFHDSGESIGVFGHQDNDFFIDEGAGTWGLSDFGINVRNPKSTLVLYSNNESTTLTNFTQATTSAGINIMTDYTASAYTPGVFWSTQNNNGDKPKAGIWLLEDGSGTDMYFGTSNNYTTGITNTALVIAEGSNVGIGSTGPTQKLDVNGVIRSGTSTNFAMMGNHPSYGTSYAAFWEDGSDYGILTSSTNTFINSPSGNLYFRNANSDKMIIEGSSGNVAIGTTTTSANKLQVYGNTTVQFGNTTTANRGFYYTDGADDLYLGGTNTQDGSLKLANTSGTVKIHIGAEDYAESTNELVNIGQDGTYGQIEAKLATNNNIGLCHVTDGNLELFVDCSSAPTDLAEYFGTSDATIEPGDLVSATGEAYIVPDPHTEGVMTTKAFIKKTSGTYEHEMIGIISTSPNQVYGGDGVFADSENPRPVSMAGRVPTKVSTINGPIVVGDRLTASSIPGVAMKATQAGWVVGIALENYDEPGVGKIITFVKPTWYDPNIKLTQDGQLVINGSEGNYSVSPMAASPLENVASGALAVFAKIKSGIITTKELVVEQSATIADLSVNSMTVAGTSLQNYITTIVDSRLNQYNSVSLENSVDQATISGTLTATTINATSVSAQNTQLGSLLTNTATIAGTLTAQEGIFTDLISQSASISGSVTAENLTIENSARIAALESKTAELEDLKAQTAELTTATVSGTLFASDIYNFDNKVAQTLQQPGIIDLITGNIPEQPSTDPIVEQLTQAGYNPSNPQFIQDSGASIVIEQDDIILGSAAVFVEKYLEVNGIAYVSETLGVGQKIMVGNGMTIGSGSIAYAPTDNSPAVLRIQPSGQGSLELLAGLMTLENGKVTITGDLKVAGKTETDTLLTNLVQPKDFGSPFQVKVAGVTTEGGPVQKSRFEIINELGSPVATISAEGKASFAGGVDVAGQDLSPQTGTTPVQTTTQISGRGTVTANTTEVTIHSDKITADSLISVTPLGSTQNQVLYVKSQTPEDPQISGTEGSFVVGFDQAIGTDLNFTWLIIN